MKASWTENIENAALVHNGICRYFLAMRVGATISAF